MVHQVLLLLLYRRLLIGVSKRYTIVWWSITGIRLVVSNIQEYASSRVSVYTLTGEKYFRWQLHLLLQIMWYNTGVWDGGYVSLYVSGVSNKTLMLYPYTDW